MVGWCEGVLYLTSPGAQLILAYSWARPAILVAGKGRGGCFYFFCFFTFIPVPLSSLSLSFISSTISSIFFLPFSGRRHKMTHKGWRVVKLQLNQSTKSFNFRYKNQYAALQTTLLHVKSLNQNETPTFVLLYVQCFQGNLYRFYLYMIKWF